MDLPFGAKWKKSSFKISYWETLQIWAAVKNEEKRGAAELPFSLKYDTGTYYWLCCGIKGKSRTYVIKYLKLSSLKTNN